MLAKVGDEEALGQLLVRYRSRLLNRIRRIVGEDARRHAESVDFLHTVLATGLDKFDPAKIKDEEHFLRWLTSIARNQIRSSQRKRRERALDSITQAGLRHSPEAPDDTPSRLADGAERRRMLAEALQGLGPDHRQVIEMHTFEGATMKQIAERMGRSEDAVRMLHVRAMFKIGRMIEE